MVYLGGPRKRSGGPRPTNLSARSSRCTLSSGRPNPHQHQALAISVGFSARQMTTARHGR